MHEILHLLGIDTQQSYAYDFWSGIATQASLMIAGGALYRKHNCHVHLCPRIGRYPFQHYFLCQKHHPKTPEKVTHLHIAKLHKDSK